MTGCTRRGSALVVALWLALLLGALAMAAARLAASGAGAAQVQADLARARAAAEGGLWAALHRLAGTPTEARPPVLDLALQIGGVEVRAVASDEDGRLDLNAAQPALLAALFRTAGLDEEAAARATALVEARRQAGRTGRAAPAFLAASELAALPGLTPEKVAALRPLVTLHTGLARPAAEAAPPALAALLAAEAAAQARTMAPGLRTPAPAARGGRRLVWRVEAVGRLGAAEGRVVAVVVLGLSGGLPGRVLEWHAAPPAPYSAPGPGMPPGP